MEVKYKSKEDELVKVCKLAEDHECENKATKVVLKDHEDAADKGIYVSKSQCD